VRCQGQCFSNGGRSSVGRVQDCDSCCRGFESRRPPQNLKLRSKKHSRQVFAFISPSVSTPLLTAVHRPCAHSCPCRFRVPGCLAEQCLPFRHYRPVAHRSARPNRIRRHVKKPGGGCFDRLKVLLEDLRNGASVGNFRLGLNGDEATIRSLSTRWNRKEMRRYRCGYAQDIKKPAGDKSEGRRAKSTLDRVEETSRNNRILILGAVNI
jgi:hypothetical protein